MTIKITNTQSTLKQNKKKQLRAVKRQQNNIVRLFVLLKLLKYTQRSMFPPLALRRYSPRRIPFERWKKGTIIKHNIDEVNMRWLNPTLLLQPLPIS